MSSEVVDGKSGVFFRALYNMIYQVVAGAVKFVKARVRHAFSLRCLSVDFEERQSGVRVRLQMQVPFARIRTTTTVGCRHLDSMETSVIGSQLIIWKGNCEAWRTPREIKRVHH
jgi:hypothetical protein